MQTDFSDEFDLSPEICHLNHAAVGPWPRRTVTAVQRFAEENGHLGSARYARWLQTEQALREQFETLINADSSDEIALLKNTSEALSVIAYGIEWHAGDEVIITNQEFPSNRIVWESLEKFGVKTIEADITQTDPESAILESLSPRTRLVSVSSVQYSSGLALDLVKIGSACRAADVLFCLDAIQSLGALPLDVQACQADFVVADGHKWMLGPEGLALFYCRSDRLRQLRLTQYGWHMVEAMGEFDRHDWEPAHTARRFECGSPNMLAIHALHASLSLLLEVGIGHIETLIAERVDSLQTGLQDAGFQLVSATRSGRRGGIVTFRHADFPSEKLFDSLQAGGVICALRGGGIRFSPHFYTPAESLQRALRLASAAIK